MVPNNITREHVLEAFARIDQLEVPPGREATKFLVHHEGKYYPPKYTLGIANIYANGIELSSDDFSGGDESNDYLHKLGFEIVEKDVYSWEVISRNELSKTLDKSAFLHHGTGVPRQLLKLFGLGNFEAGQQQLITLSVAGRKYDAKILLDKLLLTRGKFGPGFGVFAVENRDWIAKIEQIGSIYKAFSVPTCIGGGRYIKYLL